MEKFMNSTVNRRVVLAEDDSDIAFLIENHLVREGYEVFTTADGAEAINLIASYRPRVALLDIMMPSATGIEVAQLIRSSSAYRETCIVLFSARSTGRDRQFLIDFDIDDYIMKPFSTHDLLDRVESAVIRRESRNN
jgi:DNA-binding response OmpR family regulator